MNKSFILRNEDIISNCIEYISNLDKEKLWRVLIEKADIRYLQQNSFYWACMTEIADKKGIEAVGDEKPKDIVHAFFKTIFAEYNKHEIDNVLFTTYTTTTKKDPKTMYDYTQQCIQYAQNEWNIILERYSS